MSAAFSLSPGSRSASSVKWLGAARDGHDVGFVGMLRLRWGAVCGQLMALLFVATVLRMNLPYVALLGLIGFTAFSNAALTFIKARMEPSTWVVPLLLVVDAITLTLMLAFSGGASNPFTVFFLVHVALGALVLETPWVWGLVALTMTAFACLFLLPTQHVMHLNAMSGHLFGMWVAYGLSASFVAYFVSRVSRAIRERDHRLVEIEKVALQNERLVTLSSFAANAAHELGSPLATIGLAAKEMVLGLRQGKGSEALSADAELICNEVARCRKVLTDLSLRAGESIGEMPVCTTPQAVVDKLHELLSAPIAKQLNVRIEGVGTLVAPINTLAQILQNLVRNAFEAQSTIGIEDPIEMRIALDDALHFCIADRGPGLPDHIRKHLGEPFLTTKSEQGGLGLGIYLVASYVARTGGALAFRDRSGGGTEVDLRLERNALQGIVTEQAL